MDNFNNIEVIFFDLGRTLLEPASGDFLIIKAFFDKLKEHHIPYDKELFQKEKKDCFSYLVKNQKISTTEEEYNVYLEYYQLLNNRLHNIFSLDEIKYIAYDHANNVLNYNIYNEVKEMLETLSKKYKLGIISDTWPSMKKVLEYYDIRKFFSFVTYSFDLGVRKPDKQMFVDAAQKSKTDPSKCIFVDDLSANLVSAKAFGIHPILIDRNNKIDSSDFKIIHNLYELNDILNK